MGACLGALVYFRVLSYFHFHERKKTKRKLDATRYRHDRYIVVFYIIRLLIVFRMEVHRCAALLRFNLSSVLKRRITHNRALCFK